ncbi:MAG: hypothetical protein IBJ02_01960 [Brevundimonas sp.]|nr:hypothetical protein [Brevundimonas sp.]
MSLMTRAAPCALLLAALAAPAFAQDADPDTVIFTGQRDADDPVFVNVRFAF